MVTVRIHQNTFVLRMTLLMDILKTVQDPTFSNQVNNFIEHKYFICFHFKAIQFRSMSKMFHLNI